MPGLSSAANTSSWVEALLSGLRELAHVEGKSLVVESRWAEGSNDRLGAHAVERAGLKPDVLVAFQTPAALALQRATMTIPIVMVPAGDPIGTGLITSFSRSGGNITGVSTGGPELHAKGMGIFRDFVPLFLRVGVLVNAADPFSKLVLARFLRAPTS